MRRLLKNPGTWVITVAVIGIIIGLANGFVSRGYATDKITVAVQDKYELKDVQVKALAYQVQIQPYFDQFRRLQADLAKVQADLRDKYGAPEGEWQFDPDLNFVRVPAETKNDPSN